ncbi:sporulation integral membrane protein YlbJ [Virgibacillus profundi]|uniref:Sporulation integral membrane protein YlbJ n=1 Tax=Virgibacillus profundi TaxID=2024555 RepID=A0A2A2IF14_9BACI|nr:sporulation integral membrane protein YlbJ [Virgibacillus profundi]PAV29896.1 sporulation integral membrane protein YlbJ [Virgibacillus profundi]PXY54068.1 sporulation integral membrane protein YlbJ [Virgibacillus profundi]
MKQKVNTLLFAGITVFIVFSLIKFPDDALEASIRGLNMWWEVVFPSLLPFFIMAELLLAFGVVKFLGVLFEPIMRPLFNVPGEGSFGWIMGMASGYPTGAKIAARLREDKQISRIEAERLVSFTNNSSPLFIFGAVSIGFFGDAKLGVLLATCHYVGNAIVGICMRFHGRNETKSKAGKQKTKRKRVSIVRAFREMHRTRLNDKRPLGEVVGDAVLNSIKTLVMVGGFIILFSVLIKMIFLTGVSPFIAIFFEQLLNLLSLPIEMALPFFSGLFEITIGAKLISDLTINSQLAVAIVVSFILGFNGFSIQAQVASILSKTDIRFTPYFVSRFIHGTVASILTVLLYKPLYLNKQAFEMDDIPVSQDVTQNIWIVILDFIGQIGPFLTISFLGIAAFILYRRKN